MKYLSTVKFGIRESLAYRFEIILWFLIAVANIVVVYFLWQAIFSINGAAQIRGFTFDGMMAYYVIAIIVSWLTFNNLEMDFAEHVRTGALFNRIIRPASLCWQYILWRLGDRVISILLQSIPMALIAILIFNLTTTSTYFILFLISLTLAVFLSFLFSFLFGMSAFWLIKIGGLVRIKTGIEDLVSGFIIPLTFFPAKVQTLLAFLPFQLFRLAYPPF